MSENVKQHVLDAIQSGFPLASDPYSTLASMLQCTREEVVEAIDALFDDGTIRRIGASFASKKLGYVSTLCALAVPPARLDEVAAIVNACPGVTHNYARDNRYNLWFTLIAPSREAAKAQLAELCEQTGCTDLLDLPATKLFKIRVDFGGSKPSAQMKQNAASKESSTAHDRTPAPFDANNAEDVALVRWAQENITMDETGNLLQHPYAEGAAFIAAQTGTSNFSEEDVIARLNDLLNMKVIRRFGAMVRHRRMGYAFNGMTVWDIDPEHVDACGRAFANTSFVSHCYERPRAETWPHNLYAMVHAKTQEELDEHVATLCDAAKTVGAEQVEPLVLVSTKEYKKQSMKYFV